MGLFSLFRKNKQESATQVDGGYYSRSDEESAALRARSKRASSAGEPAASRAKKSNEATDPVLPEKKRARRRLVGAIALALAVAIGLPMVLDSEPKPLASDIAIRIPSKDKAPASAPAHVQTQAAASAPASAPDSAPAPAVAEKFSASDTLDKNEEIFEMPAKAEPVVRHKPAVPAPATVITELKTLGEAPPRPPRNVKPEVKPEVKAPPKPAIKAEDKKWMAEAAKPAIKPEEKKALAEAAKPVPKPVKPWAKPEEKKLAATKPDAKLDAPDAPGAPEAGDAARARAILDGQGSEKTAATDAAPAKPPGKFLVQVAALATQEKVDELQGRLKEAGIKSYTQKVPTPGGERIRIRVGPFGSKEEAEKVRAKLTKLGLGGSLVPA
jgi:DedD protein